MLPTAEQLGAIETFKGATANLLAVFPGFRDTSGLAEAWQEFESDLVEKADPQLVTDVRALPEHLWAEGVHHVIRLLDTTDASWDAEDDDDSSFCTDWLDDLLDQIPGSEIALMVQSGAIETPEQLLEWIERTYGEISE